MFWATKKVSEMKVAKERITKWDLNFTATGMCSDIPISLDVMSSSGYLIESQLSETGRELAYVRRNYRIPIICIILRITYLRLLPPFTIGPQAYIRRSRMIISPN